MRASRLAVGFFLGVAAVLGCSRSEPLREVSRPFQTCVHGDSLTISLASGIDGQRGTIGLDGLSAKIDIAGSLSRRDMVELSDLRGIGQDFSYLPHTNPLDPAEVVYAYRLTSKDYVFVRLSPADPSAPIDLHKIGKRLIRCRLRPNNSFKPKPLRGSA